MRVEQVPLYLALATTLVSMVIAGIKFLNSIAVIASSDQRAA
jgi:hypothetical protein